MNIKNFIFKFWNLWPPFFFSGIKFKASKDYRQIQSKLKLHFWNTNFVGTQYGGSIFSMADPFYMVMLIQNLGEEYVVWDKSSTIRYLKPGRTDLTAEFLITEDDLRSIKTLVQESGKMNWVKKVEIRDKSGDIVAEIEKTLSIKTQLARLNHA